MTRLIDNYKLIVYLVIKFTFEDIKCSCIVFICLVLPECGRKTSFKESFVSKNRNKSKHEKSQHQCSSSDVYEKNLSIALCPKAELEDDCKYSF